MINYCSVCGKHFSENELITTTDTGVAMCQDCFDNFQDLEEDVSDAEFYDSAQNKKIHSNSDVHEKYIYIPTCDSVWTRHLRVISCVFWCIAVTFGISFGLCLKLSSPILGGILGAFLGFAIGYIFAAFAMAFADLCDNISEINTNTRLILKHTRNKK